MHDPNDPNDPESPGMPVPDLIEQYRVRRDAWIAQADELARLRDEVRGSAEREAMEIVTAARRDVRHIVMEARRELLVLSAQVQAALGEAGARPDPTALLNRGSDAEGAFQTETHELPEAIFAPEEAVKSMLDEARADMDALVEDAKTVPFQALASASAPASSVTPPPATAAVVKDSFIPVISTPAPSTPTPTQHLTSRVLLSSPFSGDAVPVPQRPMRTFVMLFGGIGIVVVLGTLWWLRPSDTASAGRDTSRAAAKVPSPSAPAPAPAPVPAATPSSTAAAPESQTASAPSPDQYSVVVEARRSSWLRTTIDGKTDAGRTLAQGEKVTLNPQRSVSFRAGDAGAIYVAVNNGDPRPLGRDGQVATREFIVDGRESPERPVAQAPTPVIPPVVAPPAAVPPRTTPQQVATTKTGSTATAPTPTPILQPVAAPASAPPPALDPGPAAPPAREVATTPPAPVRTELPVPGNATPQTAVIAASRQWLDAYHRQDRNAMATLSTDGLRLTDDRRTDEKFPANMEVSRSLDRISVQIAADTAVLTAVMTERTPDSSMPPRVSPISQVWVLNGNQWRVKEVRLVSEARLNQIFR